MAELATISSAVSASIVWLIVAITPMRISALITSAPRSAMRLASSWIVIVSEPRHRARS
jgi:hypothetical protein